MKFHLFDQSTVTMEGSRAEERYHYESEDKSARILFNAGEQPWTWEIISNVQLSVAQKLIEAFVKTGLDLVMDDSSDITRAEAFTKAIKELEVDYHP